MNVLKVTTTVLGTMWCAIIHLAAMTVSAWMDTCGLKTEAIVQVCDTKLKGMSLYVRT